MPTFSEDDAVSGNNEVNGSCSEATVEERSNVEACGRSRVFSTSTLNDAVSSTPGSTLHNLNIKSESTASTSVSCSNATASAGGIIVQHSNQGSIASSHQPHLASVAHYATPQQQAIVANPDGTISIIHVDPDNPIITLSDGTTAQIQGIAHQSVSPSVLNLISSATANNLNQHTGSVHTLAEVAEHHAAANHAGVSTGTHAIELASAGDIHTQDGTQILIAGEDGQAYPLSGMITVPVSTGMYQAVIQGQGVGVNAGIDNGVSAGGQLVQVIGTPIQLATSSGGVQHLVKLDPTNLIKIDHEPTTVQNSSMQQHLAHHHPQQSTSNNLSVNSSTPPAIVHETQKCPSSTTRNLTITPVNQGKYVTFGIS